MGRKLTKSEYSTSEYAVRQRKYMETHREQWNEYQKLRARKIRAEKRAAEIEREEKNAERRIRYATDTTYREKLKANARNYYYNKKKAVTA